MSHVPSVARLRRIARLGNVALLLGLMLLGVLAWRGQQENAVHRADHAQRLGVVYALQRHVGAIAATRSPEMLQRQRAALINNLRQRPHLARPGAIETELRAFVGFNDQAPPFADNRAMTFYKVEVNRLTAAYRRTLDADLAPVSYYLPLLGVVAALLVVAGSTGLARRSTLRQQEQLLALYPRVMERLSSGLRITDRHGWALCANPAYNQLRDLAKTAPSGHVASTRFTVTLGAKPWWQRLTGARNGKRGKGKAGTAGIETFEVEMLQPPRAPAQLPISALPAAQPAVPAERPDPLIREVLDHVLDAVSLWEPSGKLRFANARFNHLHHARRYRDLDDYLLLITGKSAIDTANEQTAEVFDAASGRWFNLRHLRLERGAVLCVQSEITLYKEKERALERARERYHVLSSHAPIGICHSEADGTVRFFNQHARGLLGEQARFGAQRNIADCLEATDAQRLRGLLAGLAPNQTQEIEVTLPRAEGPGKTVILSVAKTQLDDDDNLILTLLDITERKAQERRVYFSAYHDALTRLPNRALFRKRLARAVGEAAGNRGEVALLLLDLDHFKDVNDTLGHAYGDKLLQRVAQRVRRCLRPADTLARLGGDEFAVIMSAFPDEAMVVDTARAIIATLTQPFMIDNNEIHIGTSVGIAFYPRHHDDTDTLLQYADTALYDAKHNGRSTFALFSERMHTEIIQRKTIEQELRAAVTGFDDIFVIYQPQFATDGLQLTGFEALVRWQHPELGLLTPDQFIPIAEATGLILPLGAKILDLACAEAKRLERRFGQPLTMAVNFSPLQFKQKAIVKTIEHCLARHALSRNTLEIELTENVLLTDDIGHLRVIDEIKALGVLFSIDDFGVGFSNLTYLLRLPIDKIKIDRRFIAPLHEGAKNRMIVEAITELAHNLDIQVTAEGVETEAQYAIIRELGCEYVQGHLFDRLVEGDAAPEHARSVVPAPAPDSARALAS